MNRLDSVEGSLSSIDSHMLDLRKAMTDSFSQVTASLEALHSKITNEDEPDRGSNVRAV